VGAQGTATLDFTSTPAEETTVIVSGQTGFVSTSAVEAWFQHGDTTVDNGVDEHEEAAALCPLACKWTVDGSFEIKAMPIAAVGMNTFKVHWVWN
jgi:hypothetical protein